MAVKTILVGQVPENLVNTFNGRTGDVTSEVGDYTASDVGALAEDGTAVAAETLATARTIRTNLASTAAASFDGSANVTPGVTGTLPVANGGTGQSTWVSNAIIYVDSTGAFVQLD